MALTPEATKISRKNAARKYQNSEKGREASRRKSSAWRKNHPEKKLWWLARSRAIAQNAPFTIQVSDIKIPDFCPVFGIPLFSREKAQGPNSPTLDRIIPSLGYVPENIMVISSQANTWKSDMTRAEINTLCVWVNKESDRVEEKLKL